MKFLINDFEGPLDLLLHLIKEAKMDIYEINTSEIIEQYLLYIHKMKDLNIDVASEYLVMAAELMHLKSKMVLNIKDEEKVDEYEINSEEDLKNKLAIYEKYKQLTPVLKELVDKRSEVFTKLPESLREYQPENVQITGDLTISDLLNAFNNMKERNILQSPLETTITKKEISVDDRTKAIRNILKVKRKMNFLELFDKITKEYVIVTFLSLLEMSKNNEIKIIQEDNFSNIFIESMI